MKRYYIALFAIGMLVGSPTLSAQAPDADADGLFSVLFPPELIMQHRRAINLTDEQRDTISRMIQELQGKVMSLQWELLDDMEALTEVLDRPRVDLDRALDQLDTVLEQEKRVKQAHLEMLIRIKNVLRPDQLEALARLRAEGGSS